MAAAVKAQPPVPPVPNPERPRPNWSWDTLPLAFHGANKSGMYTAEAVRNLSRYSMVTIEKWYTPCGAQNPQAGPSCDVEAKMYETFNELRSLKPNITLIMYLNRYSNSLSSPLVSMDSESSLLFIHGHNGYHPAWHPLIL
jgi:hypothetical protein